MFAYFMDENVYVILWGIVKFGDSALGFSHLLFN